MAIKERAMPITATEAKNRFGYFCSQAKTEPVIVEKDGRPDTVLMSYEEYRTLKAATNTRSFAKRQKEFNEQYKDWIAEQNRIVEEFGIFGEEYRVW
jgi:prevent-host-death family protein